jgi:hypothetical protein
VRRVVVDHQAGQQIRLGEDQPHRTARGHGPAAQKGLLQPFDDQRLKIRLSAAGQHPAGDQAVAVEIAAGYHPAAVGEPAQMPRRQIVRVPVFDLV